MGDKTDYCVKCLHWEKMEESHNPAHDPKKVMWCVATRSHALIESGRCDLYIDPTSLDYILGL